MKMKKIIALMLTLIVALSLASCGTQADDTENDSSEDVKKEVSGSDIKVKDMTVTAPGGWKVEHEGDLVGITSPDDPRIMFIVGTFDATGDLLPEDFINADSDIPKEAAKASTADEYGGYTANWIDKDEGVLIHRIIYKRDGVGYLINAHCDKNKDGENVDGIIKSIRFE